MRASDFYEQESVVYIPTHAKGDHSHPDCERGTVSSIGRRFVFVRFDKAVSKLGWDGATSQACDPDDLEKL